MERVVIVDDHPVVISGLRSILEENGGFIITGEAGNIEDAIKLIGIEKPDIVVADVELGCGLSGIEMVKKAHEIYPDIRIIMMSIDDGAVYAERSIKAGARGFISKVDLADSIFDAFETVKKGGIYLSSEVCDIIAGNHFRNYFRHESNAALVNLTDRELEVFQLIGRGYKRDEIAGKLKISINTVEVHRRKIRMKLNIHNASDLTKAAIQHAVQRFNIQP